MSKQIEYTLDITVNTITNEFTERYTVDEPNIGSIIDECVKHNGAYASSYVIVLSRNAE